RKYPATIILYESPFRVKETLRQIEKHVGNRQVVISREISKIHDQYIRGTCQELVEWVEEHAIKGECCILIEGNMSTEAPIDNIWWELLSIAAHVQTYEATGLTHKAAMKKAATDRQITKRDVYRKIHIDSDNYSISIKNLPHYFIGGQVFIYQKFQINILVVIYIY